jgi:hypothetical protein
MTTSSPSPWNPICMFHSAKPQEFLGLGMMVGEWGDYKMGPNLTIPGMSRRPKVMSYIGQTYFLKVAFFQSSKAFQIQLI